MALNNKTETLRTHHAVARQPFDPEHHLRPPQAKGGGDDAFGYGRDRATSRDGTYQPLLSIPTS